MLSRLSGRAPSPWASWARTRWFWVRRERSEENDFRPRRRRRHPSCTSQTSPPNPLSLSLTQFAHSLAQFAHSLALSLTDNTNNNKKPAVEKKSAAKLQDARTARKIARLDDRLVAAFAGLTADARVLVNRARIEAQSYRLTMDERPGVEHMTKHIAGIQQKYTQSGGVRPFGISTLIAGFDSSEAQKPALYQTDPSGTYSAWRAAAIGRNAKSAREFLEKQYEGADVGGEMGAAKLALRALAETVEVSSATAEVAVLGKKGEELRYLTAEEVDAVVAEVEADKAAADAARRAAGPPEPMA